MIASINENTFNQEVLKSSIPVLVHFWTPWCGPCKRIEPLVSQLEHTAPYPVKVVRVNADENFWLAKLFHLTSIPTILLFHKGEVIHRLEHLDGREENLRSLGVVLQNICLSVCDSATDAVVPSEPLRKPISSGLRA
ncbi:MAG TPA: thioredoxin family protein [Stenomitos sp.]